MDFCRFLWGVITEIQTRSGDAFKFEVCVCVCAHIEVMDQ